MKKLIYTKKDGWHESQRTCPQCNEILTKEGHFVPPSLGEEGFYICEVKETAHES
jgi:DNA polymerase III alpha subunit (gram-positive type)